MMRCSKCGVEKDESNYQKYFHSTQNKWRVRKECTECLYKTRLKRKNPELYYSQDPNYKKCKTCQEWKLVDEFHFHSRVTGVRFTVCKICQRQADKLIYEQELEDKGGNERIPVKPNHYQDKYQKEQTFMVMEVLGYTYNEEMGIWTKPGVKELIDGKIVFPKVKKRKKLGTYESRVTFDMVKKIFEYKNMGWNYQKIGDKLDISDTTVYKHYKRWKDTLK